MNLENEDQESIGTTLEFELNKVLLNFHPVFSATAEGSSNDQFINGVMDFVNGMFSLKCVYIRHLVALAVKFVDRRNFEASLDTSLFNVWEIIITRLHAKEEK